DLSYPDYNFGDFLPQLVDVTASFQGRRIGVPFDIPIFIMMYRKDIFDQLKLKVPTTMAEYMQTVKAIHEAKSGQGVMGTVGSGRAVTTRCSVTRRRGYGRMAGSTSRPTTAQTTSPTPTARAWNT